MEEFFTHIVNEEESGERIDALLARKIPDMTRNSVQNLLENGAVSVSGAPVRKNYRVRANDRIDLELPEISETELVPQDLPLNVLYEDSDLLVINKARGMVVHPAPGHVDGTLVNALLFHCRDSLSGIGGEKRPGIVHRIDKDTSGLLIVAKNDFSHQALSAQLSDHSLYREYEAVVRGRMRDNSGTVHAPVGRHPVDRKRMAVPGTAPRDAVTHWEVIARYQAYTHIRCHLETGRTHQIRVHMAYIGHPLLGDYTYGSPAPDKGLTGQCLHAKQLHFIHPRTGEAVTVTSDLPEYFQEVLGKLGKEI